jgi:hypothetical protein
VEVRIRTLTAISLVLLLVVTIAPAFAGDEQRDDQTVGVTVQTPGLLAIDVDAEVALGISEPGTTTGAAAFHVGIVNDTGEGWEVYVTASDFESFVLKCDDAGKNCVQAPTDPVYRIDARNLHIRGGIGDMPDAASALSASEGQFEAAGMPLLLLTGSSAAAGTFGVDEPLASLWLDVPSSTPDGEYAATLTYTIMGIAP